MTQRLIGAKSNKRMECPVFRISGKSCPETMTLSTMRFFPVHDGTKTALTMRENLPFSVKNVLLSKNYIERIAASNENLRGSRRKQAYLHSGLSKNAKQVRRAVRCVLLSIRRISSAFYVQENAAAVLRLLMTRGCVFVHSAGEVRAAFFEKPIRLTGQAPLSLYAAYSPICICSTTFTFPSRKKKARFSF